MGYRGEHTYWRLPWHPELERNYPLCSGEINHCAAIFSWNKLHCISACYGTSVIPWHISLCSVKLTSILCFSEKYRKSYRIQVIQNNVTRSICLRSISTSRSIYLYLFKPVSGWVNFPCQPVAYFQRDQHVWMTKGSMNGQLWSMCH